MTPRKELFIKIKQALQTIPQLEYIDWNRGQFENPKSAYPEIWTAALIQIQNINYETMVEHGQEGNCVVEVALYCKDGWMDQHNTTADPEHGLIEIDLLDKIADTLQFLHGEQFKPLQQIEDENGNDDLGGIMRYNQRFETMIYRKTPYPFKHRKIGF